MVALLDCPSRHDALEILKRDPASEFSRLILIGGGHPSLMSSGSRSQRQIDVAVWPNSCADQAHVRHARPGYLLRVAAAVADRRSAARADHPAEGASVQDRCRLRSRPPSALLEGRKNQLIEDGVYPGLEQAFEDLKLPAKTIRWSSRHWRHRNRQACQACQACLGRNSCRR